MDSQDRLEMNNQKKFHKSLFLLIPSGVFGILTVDVISNVNHRKVVEDFAPYYVQFVRKHYGFSDENEDEIKRFKRLRALQQLDYRYELRDQKLCGVKSGRDLVHTHDLCGNGHCYNLSFLDQPTDEREEATRELKDINSHFDPTPVPSDCLMDSQWNDVSIDYTNYPVTFNRSLLQKYDHPIRTLLSGLQKYDDQYSSGFLHPFYNLTASNLRPAADKTSSSRNNSGRTQQEIDRQNALSRIQELETELGELEQMKQIGSLDIDTIQSLSAEKKGEIQTLRRKYLNWFYFF